LQQHLPQHGPPSHPHWQLGQSQQQASVDAELVVIWSVSIGRSSTKMLRHGARLAPATVLAEHRFR
jgi:hypothetical protein